uniref:Metalloendopeptidase n=1 Tax=Parastrongyloides trichosuri TaxID=131310 RepID=A0A0N4Z7K0_PARTI
MDELNKVENELYNVNYKIEWNQSKPEELIKFFQTDIILSFTQINDIIKFNKNLIEKSTSSRYFIKIIKRRGISSNKRWVFPIKYYVCKNLDREIINEAIKTLENNTCVKFKESNECFTNTSGIIFHKSNNCYSFVGKYYKNKPQTIGIGPACNTSVTSIIHEIAHALGLYHEQSRPDRDDVIIFLKDYVDPKYTVNFAITPEDTVKLYETGYDFGSAMHYPFTSYGINNTGILMPKIYEYKNMMGQRYEMTFNDYKKINLHYCGKKCKRWKTKCFNSGYRNPKNCGKCICPNGYKGRKCTLLKPQEPGCGRRDKFTMKNVTSIIMVSGVKNCTFRIRTSKENRIRINITNAKFNKKIPCYINMGLEIKYDKDKGATGLCLCGPHDEIVLTSSLNEVLVFYTGKRDTNMATISYEEV